MIQNAIKKMLRKWLKKKLHCKNISLTSNVANFEWVYSSPLCEWRDRIWVVNHCRCIGKDECNKYLEFITSNFFQ